MDPQLITRRLVSRLSSRAGEPAAHVIAEDLWTAVVEGTLETGARLPTTRQLAVDLGVSPVSVERAYEELEARGVIATRPGQGTYISLETRSEAELERRRAFARLCRQAIEEARELGFGVDDLIQELGEYRTLDREP